VLPVSSARPSPSLFSSDKQPIASIFHIRFTFLIALSECFQEVSYHKYRAAVSKAKVNRDQETILLALSTGESSRLLLYLSQLARIQEPARKNLDTFVAIHVQDETHEDAAALIAYCEELGLELLTINLSTILPNELLASCRSETVKCDLKRILLKRLLVEQAEALGCSKVYLDDCNDRIAINAMADVCAGRGSAVPWSQLPSQTINGVTFVRPLRDLQAQEVHEYLGIIGMSIPASQPTPKDTIYGLTDSFITGLAKDFAATPSIVTKTTAKIMTDLTPLASDHHCSLCCCPLVEPAKLCEACESLSSELDASLL
jgi:hypothetical protein